MLTTRKRSLLLSIAVGCVGVVAGLGQSPESKDEIKVGGVAVSVVFECLGATMEHGVSRSRLSLYSQHYDRIDHNQDGVHSKTEFIESGSYPNARSRRGIFLPLTGTGMVRFRKPNISLIGLLRMKPKRSLRLWA